MFSYLHCFAVAIYGPQKMYPDGFDEHSSEFNMFSFTRNLVLKHLFTGQGSISVCSLQCCVCFVCLCGSWQQRIRGCGCRLNVSNKTLCLHHIHTIHINEITKTLSAHLYSWSNRPEGFTSLKQTTTMKIILTAANSVENYKKRWCFLDYLVSQVKGLVY